MKDLYGAFEEPRPDSASLGRRAAALRRQLGKTREDVARQVGVPTSDLRTFEETGEASVQLLMGLLDALTPSGYLDHAFETPRFASINEVLAFEERRTARR
jgi:transcriptional regulator with XRE-family HTH domain